MDVFAGLIQNGIVVILVILIVAGVGIWLLEQLENKKNKEQKEKDLYALIEKDLESIFEVKNLLLGKKDSCERERTKLKETYSQTFDLLNEVGFRHMGSYVSAHIGKTRYEKLLKDKEEYICYKDALNERMNEYKYLYSSFEEYLEREQENLPVRLEQLKDEDFSEDFDEINEVVGRIDDCIASVKQSISELKPISWESSKDILLEEEIVNLKRLVEAGEVEFSSIIYAVLQEKDKPDTRIWANHLPYNEETGEALSGCFAIDDMAIDEMNELSDRLDGGYTGLAIAACPDMAGLLFSDKSFTIRFINSDDEEEVVKDIKEYPLALGCQYTVECQFANKEWNLRLIV
jgi:hypothetical protein